MPVKAPFNVQHELTDSMHDAHGSAWCLRLGMSTVSWDGWAKLHVNPSVAIGYYYVSWFLATAISAYICTGIRGEELVQTVVLVSLVCYTATWAGMGCIFWRFGPSVAHNSLYQRVMALASLCLVPCTYVGFLGPDATVPWSDRFHFLCVNSLWTFVMLQNSAAGGVAGEHPAEPRTRIMEPFLRSAILTLMLVDAISDFALARSFVAEVCSPWPGCASGEHCQNPYNPQHASGPTRCRLACLRCQSTKFAPF